MRQVIGMVCAGWGIEILVSIWVVVPDDELLSITVLGKYSVITNSGVNLVSPLRYYCKIFCRKVMFSCVCFISSVEYFWIICFRYEKVVWMNINSMGYRVNCNRLAPHHNISWRLYMTRRHGGYKLFVSWIILFDKLEIGAIPGEYAVPSNWRLQVILLVQHSCSNRIRGVRYSGSESIDGISSH